MSNQRYLRGNIESLVVVERFILNLKKEFAGFVRQSPLSEKNQDEGEVILKGLDYLRSPYKSSAHYRCRYRHRP